MVDAKRFKDEINTLLDELYDSQKDNIEATAQALKECIEKGGVCHVFGSGHSVGLGIDIKDRIGALVPIHIMEMSDFVTKGGVPAEEFMDTKNIFERKPNVAGKLYDLYNMKPQDIFIVISNSGINGIVIDIILEFYCLKNIRLWNFLKKRFGIGLGGHENVNVCPELGDVHLGKTVLLFAEEIPGASQSQILVGNLKAVIRPSHDIESLLCRFPG